MTQAILTALLCGIGIGLILGALAVILYFVWGLRAVNKDLWQKHI